MIRTLIWWAYFPISLFLKLPQIKKLEKTKDKISQQEYWKNSYEIARVWAKPHLAIAGISKEKGTYEVKGKENILYDRPALYVANHQGNFDTALLMVDLDIPKGFVAKVELSNIPVLTRMMNHMGCIFMDRDDPKKQLKAILTGIDHLKNGLSICIYPEGTRGKDATLGEFKAGSFKLATKTKVPVVPITINGTYNLLEKNKIWLKKTKVQVVIHEPIETKDLTKEEIKELPTKVRSIIEQDLWKD